jgi:hypothetical protein
LHGYLRTSGRVFVDDSGATVQLRGFGLGGWLVQEGYMWNTDGFYGSTSMIQQKIIELVGDSAASHLVQNRATVLLPRYHQQKPGRRCVNTHAKKQIERRITKL